MKLATVVFEGRQGVAEITVPAGERLLYCGLRHGLNLGHECASGTCGTCKAMLVSGQVGSLWPEAPGNRYVRPERDEFLMCQAIAESDVHVKVRPAVPAPVDLPVPGILQGVIRKYENLTSDVAQFELKLSQPVRFLAGQFITVNIDGIAGYRAYSMTGYSPQATDALSFVVKRIAGGKFTEWLFTGDRDGAAVTGFGPLGRAVFAPDKDGSIIALAGGSGIAGIMAILRHASDSGHLEQYEAQLVFGLNRPQDVFFLGTLNELAAKHSNLRVVIALVDIKESDALQQQFPELEFEQGYLHDVSRMKLQNLDEVTTAFLAGPPVAVDAVREMLIKDKGFSARKMRFDRFG